MLAEETPKSFAKAHSDFGFNIMQNKGSWIRTPQRRSYLAEVGYEALPVLGGFNIKKSDSV
jgi:hypothetical protein